MKIKWKITALIAILFVALVVAELLVAKNVLMPSFSEFENREADTAMRRVQYGLDTTLTQLALSAGSWGNWTDAYRFAQDKNEKFINEQVTAAGLQQLNINTLLFIDLSGHTIASNAIDLQNNQKNGLDLAIQRDFDERFPWRINLRESRFAKGLMQTDQGILLIVAAPILNGYGHGPSRGMVIMGRLLSSAEIQEIGAHAQANIVTLPPRNACVPTCSVVTADIVQIYRTVEDIYGKPVMTLRVDFPREITQRGYSAVRYASACLFTAAIIIVVLLVFTLNRLVLSPLDRVTRHAVCIGEGKDLTTRLNFKGNDEIDILANEFDRMVARVAESRRQLVDQSFEAGMAEVATNVLHNVGNILNSVNVSANVITERIKQSKMPGVSRIAGLLLEQGSHAGQFIANDERGRRIPSYLATLGEQLLTEQQLALTELASLRNNLEHIKNTVITQQNFAKHCGVTEIVTLAELLEDSVRLNIDALTLQNVTLRREYSEVPAITVDRHKVLQILINMISNANHACNDSGHPDKVITLRIENSTLGVRVCVNDNGIGIAADNMDRLFVHGFTTRQSGHGFGLHSAAIAAHELGGSLQAHSDGLGQGATFILDLPITHTP